jgi:hypothetical protein
MKGNERAGRTGQDGKEQDMKEHNMTGHDQKEDTGQKTRKTGRYRTGQGMKGKYLLPVSGV